MEASILVRQHPTLQLQLYPLPQLLHLDRFDHVIVSPLLQGRHRVLDIGVGGHQQKRQLRILGTNRTQELVAVHPRHPDVGNDRIHGLTLAQALERLLGGGEGVEGVSNALQGPLHRVAGPIVIVHKKNHCRHLLVCPAMIGV